MLSLSTLIMIRWYLSRQSRPHVPTQYVMPHISLRSYYPIYFIRLSRHLSTMTGFDKDRYFVRYSFCCTFNWMACNIFVTEHWWIIIFVFWNTNWNLKNTKLNFLVLQSTNVQETLSTKKTTRTNFPACSHHVPRQPPTTPNLILFHT